VRGRERSIRRSLEGIFFISDSFCPIEIFNSLIPQLWTMFLLDNIGIEMNMKDDPSIGDIERLAPSKLVSDGFAAINGFLDRIEVEQVKTLVDRLMSQPLDCVCVRPHNTLVPLSWHDPIVQFILLSQHKMHVLRHASAGDDLRWISGYVSRKEPLSPPLWWHQDWWCWDHPVSYLREPVQIALLCYLTDTTVRNGALRVLPGSHCKSAAIHSILPVAHSQSAESLPDDHPAMSDIPQQVTLELKAGDAVVLDYRLLHGSHGNSTAKTRDAILLSFTPSWAHLPGEIRAHLIDHPALPTPGESVQTSKALLGLIPTFLGIRRTLRLNRNVPTEFEIS
jgi:hypothetical protein